MRLLAPDTPCSPPDGCPHTAQAAGEHLPFASGTFDALLMECCLASTSRPLFVLSEAVRVLKAGGKLALNDLYRRIPSPAVHVPSDLRQVPTQAEYFDMLRATGMEILRWEDHSTALRTFAARWVWGHGRDALPPGLEGFCAAGRPWSDEFRRQTPGYGMLLALKPVQRQVKMRYP
jgi:SAM-dependent methyltransferase